jgi:hypothetical protein
MAQPRGGASTSEQRDDEKIVDSACYKRAAVTKKMTPAQIANAQKSAREWKPTL